MKSPVPGFFPGGSGDNRGPGRQPIDSRLLAGFVEPPVDVTNHVRRVPMAADHVFEPPAGVPETLRRSIFRGGRRRGPRDPDGARPPDALAGIEQLTV